MDIDKIKTAFLETNYIILLENQIVLKIGEMPTQLLNEYSQIKTWPFITGWNPLPNILTKSENDIRNNQLNYN